MQSSTSIASRESVGATAVVPLRAEALSAEWLSACLRADGAIPNGARVARFEAVRIGQGRGFAGRLMRVTLHYEPATTEGPRTLIAKFATDHGATRDMMESMNGYAREVRFYRELAAQIDVPTPRCYFGHCDENGAGLCLLLEDLAPAASMDVEVGLDFEQAKLVLEQLASMHARWWNRVDEVPWLAISDQLIAEMRARFVAAVPGFRALHGARFPLITQTAERLMLLMRDDQLLQIARKPPLTLSHNDLHLDNVFLPNARGGRFALIDWQGASATRHGTTDLSRILCVGLKPELRRAHQAELLAHYHARMCQLGVRDFSLRTLKRRFRQEMAATVIIGVMAFQTLDFDGEGGRRAVDVIGERVEQTLRDARIGRTMMLVTPFYRLRFFLRRLFGRTPRLPPTVPR